MRCYIVHTYVHLHTKDIHNDLFWLSISPLPQLAQNYSVLQCPSSVTNTMAEHQHTLGHKIPQHISAVQVCPHNRNTDNQLHMHMCVTVLVVSTFTKFFSPLQNIQ